MNIELFSKNLKDIAGDLEVVFVFEKKLNELEDKDVLKKIGFKGEDEEVVLLAGLAKLYVGCEKTELDSFRIAASCAIRKVQSTNYKSMKLLAKNCKYGFSALLDGLMLGAYSYDRYKSKKPENKDIKINISCVGDIKEYEEKLKEKEIICKNVNMVRDIANTPPQDYFPQTMADDAKKIAKENKNITCKILEEDYLKANSMNAMLAVGKASIHRSKLIHLSYKPKNAKIKIALVGKGVTYDSGGLSLKPGSSMVSMKSDKSGGSAVMGIVKSVAELGLAVEIHGVVGAVENMIGGDAYKPDDVLIAKNGTSIEVQNTDAEGRLVLCDCLCYIQDELKEFDYIFDYATLTGACVVGLGEYTSGLMGHNEELKLQVLKDASFSGENATPLHFNRFLQKTLKSDIADICNISSTRYGGSITAGCFLDKFIYEKNKNKWVHFDIAGPAFTDKSWGYNPSGATGAGLRMSVEFIKNLVK